jgi:hypothetical protein
MLPPSVLVTSFGHVEGGGSQTRTPTGGPAGLLSPHPDARGAADDESTDDEYHGCVLGCASTLVTGTE